MCFTNVDSLTKASDADLWCFRWSAPDQPAEQTIETPVYWDAIALIMTSVLYYKMYCSETKHTFIWYVPSYLIQDYDWCFFELNIGVSFG